MVNGLSIQALQKSIGHARRINLPDQVWIGGLDHILIIGRELGLWVRTGRPATGRFAVRDDVAILAGLEVTDYQWAWCRHRLWVRVADEVAPALAYADVVEAM